MKEEQREYAIQPQVAETRAECVGEPVIDGMCRLATPCQAHGCTRRQCKCPRQLGDSK